MSFAVGGTSGGHFNPAISIGMWTARKVSTPEASYLYIAAQLLGGFAAYYLYTYFVNNKLQAVGGHYTGRILVAEAIGAASSPLAGRSCVPASQLLRWPASCCRSGTDARHHRRFFSFYRPTEPSSGPWRQSLGMGHLRARSDNRCCYRREPVRFAIRRFRI